MPEDKPRGKCFKFWKSISKTVKKQMLQSNHQHALSSWSYKSRTSSLITVSYLTCEENWSPNVEEDWLPRSHTHLSLSCGVCTPVYVPFPGSQTRNVWSLKKTMISERRPTNKKTKSVQAHSRRYTFCPFRDVAAIVFSNCVPHALKCIHKNGRWDQTLKLHGTRSKTNPWHQE